MKKYGMMTVRCVLGLVLLNVGLAYGNAYESSLSYPARYNGLMGAGLASVDGGAAAVMNPAGLARTEGRHLEFTVNPLYIHFKGPANGAHTEELTTGVFPLLYLGLAYPITDRVTIGGLLYTPAGAGVTTPDINFNLPDLPKKDSGGSLGVVEMGPVVAVNLSPSLRVGAGYRVNFAMMKQRAYDLSQMANGMVTYNEMSLSGWGASGFRLGLQYQPTERLHVGLIYKSTVTMDLSGETTVTSVSGEKLAEIDTDLESVYPDKVGVGLTYEVLPDMLRLLVDCERHFAGKLEDLTLKTPAGGSVIISKDLDYTNIRIGAEYRPEEQWPIRVGLGYTGQIYNAEYTNPARGAPPGPLYTLATGTSYRFNDQLEMQVAANLTWGSAEVNDADQTAFSVPGDYSLVVPYLALGLTYQF